MNKISSLLCSSVHNTSTEEAAATPVAESDSQA
jgi:hypothetical protein